MIGCGYCTEVAKPSKVILDKIFCFNKQDIIFAYSRFSDLEILHDIHLKENQISDNIKRIEVNIANHIIDAMSALCGKIHLLSKKKVCVCHGMTKEMRYHMFCMKILATLNTTNLCFLCLYPIHGTIQG